MPITKEEKEQNNNSHLPIKYNLRNLLEPEGTIEILTQGGVAIPITLKLLRKLVAIPKNEREPTDVELLMFANMAIDQKLNPYLAECWLVWLGRSQGYQPIVAAQSRIRKAQGQADYDGYKWGWIDKDGLRHSAGQESKILPDNIIGVWGELKRKAVGTPFYHEVFKSEYAKTSQSGRGTWEQRPITMLLKVIRDQTHKFAYADQMGNLFTENEAHFITDLPDAAPTPQVPARDERKQAEGVTITDTVETIKAEITRTFDKFKKFAGSFMALDTDFEGVPDKVLWEVFAVFAAGILPKPEDAKAADYKNAANYTLEDLANLQAAIECNGIPEDILALIPLPTKDADKVAEDKLTTHDYQCNDCHHVFDKPGGGKKIALCPKCLSKNIITTKEVGAKA